MEQQKTPYEVRELAINIFADRAEFDAAQLGGLTCGGGTPKPLIKIPLTGEGVDPKAKELLIEKLKQALRDLGVP